MQFWNQSKLVLNGVFGVLGFAELWQGEQLTWILDGDHTPDLQSCIKKLMSLVWKTNKYSNVDSMNEQRPNMWMSLVVNKNSQKDIGAIVNSMAFKWTKANIDPLNGSHWHIPMINGIIITSIFF